LKFLIGAIGLIASIIGIYVFLTGEQNINEVLNNTSKGDNLGTALKSNNKFIGALDGRYNHKSNNIIANADFNHKRISFIAGNCVMTMNLKQNGISWDSYLIEKDGVCKFLNELKIGDKIIRIIPVPGALANSGRVLEFIVQSGEYVIDDFFGTYILE